MTEPKPRILVADDERKGNGRLGSGSVSQTFVGAIPVIARPRGQTQGSAPTLTIR